MLSKIILMILVALALSACGDKAEPGTSLAARFMAAEFVGKLYDVEPVSVTDEPVVNGDTAKVTTIFKDKACIVGLVKHPTANKYGWVAESIQCGKVTQEELCAEGTITARDGKLAVCQSDVSWKAIKGKEGK